MATSPHKRNVSQRYEVKQLRAVEKVEEDVNKAVCDLYNVNDISLTPLDIDLYKIWERDAAERLAGLIEGFKGIPDSPEKDKIIQDAMAGMEAADALGPVTAARKELG